MRALCLKRSHGLPRTPSSEDTWPRPPEHATPAISVWSACAEACMRYTANPFGPQRRGPLEPQPVSLRHLWPRIDQPADTKSEMGESRVGSTCCRDCRLSAFASFGWRHDFACAHGPVWTCAAGVRSRLSTRSPRGALQAYAALPAHSRRRTYQWRELVQPGFYGFQLSASPRIGAIRIRAAKAGFASWRV